MPKYFWITMAAVSTNLIVLMVTYNWPGQTWLWYQKGGKLQTDGRLWPYAEVTDKSRLWLTDGWGGLCLGTRPLRYFCCEMDLCWRGRIGPSGWRREVAGIGTIQLDLLKTGVLASLYRLEGALDAAGDCWNYGE